MSMPKEMPPLFSVEKGLDENLKDEKVVFEKYIQTRMGNAEANRLFANGDLYKVFLGSNQSLKKDDISWSKVGSISQDGLAQMEEAIDDEVLDFLGDGPHERVAQAVENINWYFYFNENYFVQSQVRQWKRNPKFMRKLDRIVERNFKPSF